MTRRFQSHSEKEGAAGNIKGGFGFHPMLAYLDESSEAAAGMLRAGNAGANTAADQIEVAEQALEQIPSERVAEIEVLLRCDSVGAAHELFDWAREGGIRFSVGFDLSETVREAILALPQHAWGAAVDQDGSQRENGEVAELTQLLDLSRWPERSRVIVRRERPTRAPSCHSQTTTAIASRRSSPTRTATPPSSSAATAPGPGSRTRSSTQRTPASPSR